MRFSHVMGLCLCLNLNVAFGAESHIEALGPPKDQIRIDHLDRLFGKLHGGRADEHDQAEAEIWSLWAEPQSPTSEVVLQEANLAMQDGEFSAARTLLDKLISLHPDMAEAYNRRAALFYLTHHWPEALADLDKALELEPRHFAAWAGRGLVLQAQQKWSEAIAAYREALKINPHMPSVDREIKAILRSEQNI